MKSITSRDNPLYKRLKALAGSTSHQRRGGQALLEGFHLASAYLDTGATPELCVTTEGALGHAEAQAIVARIDAQRIVTLPDATAISWRPSPLTSPMPNSSMLL